MGVLGVVKSTDPQTLNHIQKLEAPKSKIWNIEMKVIKKKTLSQPYLCGTGSINKNQGKTAKNTE